MHHNLAWIHDLEIEYDASTFDTDPFEPQPDGVGTIFPFWVSKDGTQKGYVELPYTLPQDFTLFILMKEKNIDIWKQKLDWIAENGGMALVNTHPDYMNFDDGKLGIEEYPAQYYQSCLSTTKINMKGNTGTCCRERWRDSGKKMYDPQITQISAEYSKWVTKGHIK